MIFPLFSQSANIFADFDLWTCKLSSLRWSIILNFIKWLLLWNENIFQELLDDSFHGVPLPVQMKTTKQIMNAHEHSAAALGDSQKISPLGDDKKRLSAAGDENEKYHCSRVDFVTLGDCPLCTSYSLVVV